MHTSIEFPNIGIHLENVGKTLTVFGFDIAYYGIVIGIGMLAGIGMAMMEAKRTGRTRRTTWTWPSLASYSVLSGPGIYYVVFAWDMYKDNLLEIFKHPPRGTGHLRRRHSGGDHCVCGGEGEKAACDPTAGYGGAGTCDRADDRQMGQLL